MEVTGRQGEVDAPLPLVPSPTIVETREELFTKQARLPWDRKHPPPGCRGWRQEGSMTWKRKVNPTHSADNAAPAVVCCGPPVPVMYCDESRHDKEAPGGSGSESRQLGTPGPPGDLYRQPCIQGDSAHKETRGFFVDNCRGPICLFP